MSTTTATTPQFYHTLHDHQKRKRMKIGAGHQRDMRSQFERRKDRLLKAVASFGDYFQCDIGLVVISSDDKYSVFCNAQLDDFLFKVNKYLSENISSSLFCGQRHSEFPTAQSRNPVMDELKMRPSAKRVKKDISSTITHEDAQMEYFDSVKTDNTLEHSFCETGKIHKFPAPIKAVRSGLAEFNEIENNAKKAALNDLFSGCDTSGESFINKAKELARNKVPIRAKCRDKKSKYQKLNDEIMKINASGSYNEASFKISSLLSSSSRNNTSINSYTNNNPNDANENNSLPPLQAQNSDPQQKEQAICNEARPVILHLHRTKQGQQQQQQQRFHQKGTIPNTINFKNVFESTSHETASLLPPLQISSSDDDGDEPHSVGLPSILNIYRLPPFSEIIDSLNE